MKAMQDKVKIWLEERRDGEALIAGLNGLWDEMTEPEKRDLFNNRDALALIGLGGLSDLGLFDDEEIDPDWTAADLGLDLTDLDVWVRSARTHAADTGEPEYALVDLEGLVFICGEVLGTERAARILEKIEFGSEEDGPEA